MNLETKIQNQIRVALSEAGCIVHRCNTGTMYTRDGRAVKIGEKGHSDLYGHRPDGMAWYLEIKQPGGYIRPEQIAFIDAMVGSGAIAGIAHSVEEALRIVMEKEA